jgi:tetratricopeptide (TPR) repeat protein
MAIQNDHDRASELRGLGESARRRRDLPGAQKLYDEAASLLRDSPDRMKFAHTVRHLGDVYVEMKNWASAESCYKEALDIYRGQPDGRILDFANALRSYAVLKEKTGRAMEARQLWAEAGALYEAEAVQAGVEECRRHTSQSVETAL